MAHPLTQHPPPSLPFPSAPRPSPLAFGFGLPSTASPLAFGTPPRSPFTQSSTSSSNVGFGFANLAASSSNSPFNAAAGPSNSPSTFAGINSPKRTPVQPGITPSVSSPSAFRSATAPSLKRGRRSPSPTPSSSPSPSSSNVASPALTQVELPKKDKDDLSVGLLALKDDSERRIVRKDQKRLRKALEQESKGPSGGTDVDAGVLLAALPPASHLPILMNLLSKHPYLTQEVITSLPQPDLTDCLSQMEKHIEKVRRATGPSLAQINHDRVWTRIQKEVETFSRIASTYLTFFTSPPNPQTSSPGPQIIQNLLHTLSTHTIYLLRLIPPNTDVGIGTTRVLLDLGKRVIDTWSKWLEALSTEVNQRSGMYPLSTVEVWAFNLDNLSNGPAQSQQSQATFGWSYSQPAEPEVSHPLVESYRGAMKPIRDRFINELGWLIGRNPVPSFGSNPRPAQQGGWDSSIATDQDEDL